jgi:arsenate reductase
MSTNVLFLCTGNSCRSQMAEALLRQRSEGAVDAYSAGLDPQGVNPLTIRVLDEIGIDTSPLRSKMVKEYLGRLLVHYLIIVCDHAEANCPYIFPGLSERLFWPFDDPARFEGTEAERLEKFREVRDQIDERIQSWLAEMRAAGKL